MSVYHAAGDYDAKTLIRHAIVALENELGPEPAYPYTLRLLTVFEEVKALEIARRTTADRHKRVHVIGPGEDQ